MFYVIYMYIYDCDSADVNFGEGATVILASYEALRRDPLKSVIFTVNLGAVVLDEGQRIKNCDAEISLLCRRLRFAEQRIHTHTLSLSLSLSLSSICVFIYYNYYTKMRHIHKNMYIIRKKKHTNKTKIHNPPNSLSLLHV
jgi:hypothetical protein